MIHSTKSRKHGKANEHELFLFDRNKEYLKSILLETWWVRNTWKRSDVVQFQFAACCTLAFCDIRCCLTNISGCKATKIFETQTSSLFLTYAFTECHYLPVNFTFSKEYLLLFCVSPLERTLYHSGFLISDENQSGYFCTSEDQMCQDYDGFLQTVKHRMTVSTCNQNSKVSGKPSNLFYKVLDDWVLTLCALNVLFNTLKTSCWVKGKSNERTLASSKGTWIPIKMHLSEDIKPLKRSDLLLLLGQESCNYFLLTTAAPKSIRVPKIFMITEPVWDTVESSKTNLCWQVLAVIFLSDK